MSYNRLLYILLYNTGIYWDEYTAWKAILDEPIGESYMPFQAVYNINQMKIFNLVYKIKKAKNEKSSAVDRLKMAYI